MEGTPTKKFKHLYKICYENMFLYYNGKIM